MPYKALTFINLPYTSVRKAPGETITKAEFKDAKQSDEQVAAMLKAGSISEDLTSDILPEHLPVSVPNTGGVHVVTSDEGVGESANG